jgi:hypothetical protein
MRPCSLLKVRQCVSGISPPKLWLTFNRLNGDVSQTTELFITTAVRTSDPVNICLVICSLFKDDVINSDYRATNECVMVNNKMQRMQIHI